MANQKIRTESHQFPKDKNLNEIVRQHNSQHREGEKGKTGKIARIPGVVVHVLLGVKEDEAPDARHDKEHEKRQAVDQDTKFYIGGRQDKPVDGRFKRFSGDTVADEKNEGKKKRKKDSGGCDPARNFRLAEKKEKNQTRRKKRDPEDKPAERCHLPFKPLDFLGVDGTVHRYHFRKCRV